jgi:hypothetical protein
VNAVRATESLGSGQEAQVAPDGTIQRNAKADVMKTVAWRERRLIFDDAPLALEGAGPVDRAKKWGDRHSEAVARHIRQLISS